MKMIFLTLLNVLVFVERLDGVILGEATEGVDQMGAEVGVDVLRGELGGAWNSWSFVNTLSMYIHIINHLPDL